MVDHADIESARPDARDTAYPEPPALRRLGTLAELTRGAIGTGDDAMGGLSGDAGSF